MDTLEWGASDRPVGAGYAPWRPVPRWLGPPVALWLGGAGVALAVTAEVLPWASAAQSSGGGSLSVDNLTGVPTLGYYLCWMGLLAAAGLVVAGRPAQRRPAAGAAFGLGAGLAIVLAGMARAILAGTQTILFSGAPGGGFTSRIAAADATPLSVGPGLFAACAGLGMVLAAVVVGLRRRRAVSGALSAAAPGAAAQPDEPADLIVQPLTSIEELAELDPRPLTPAEEQLFTRPDR